MDDFFEFYDLEKKVVFSEAPREEDPKNGGERRVCRFCKQIEAPFGATFEKKAHTISKALGNKHLLSSDECDECNTRFSRYENEFTRYIELRRALYDGLKRFTTREGRFTAESSKQINGATKISDKTPDLLHTKTLDNGDVLISAPTNSYIPIMVYRSLLKFALAITDRKYLDDYEDTFKALIDDNLHNNLCATAKICRDTVNIQVKGHCCIFKRKDTKQRVPNHIVVFGYKDLILQFFLPYSRQDRDLYRHTFTPKLFSPNFYKKESSSGRVNYNRKVVDLSGFEKVDHSETFLLSFNEEKSEKFAGKNPFTKLSDEELFPDIVSSQIIIAPFDSGDFMC